jgi:uncharacterized protein
MEMATSRPIHSRTCLQRPLGSTTIAGEEQIVVSDILLQRIKSRLAEAFGDRLCGVVLHGSEARGEARPDSDIDILMLLKGPVDLGEDIDASTRATYPLMLEIDRIIDVRPVDISNYEAALAPLYRRAQREGILV